jgi:hypothetical protein
MKKRSLSPEAGMAALPFAWRIMSWTSIFKLLRQVLEWCWSKEAYRVEDQIKNTKAGSLLEKIKSFTRFCLKMNWITRDPASQRPSSRTKPAPSR